MAIPTLSNNSPAAGKIAWGAFVIKYNNVAYSVGAASTDQKFVWWKYNAGAPSIVAGAVLPATLTDDDLVLFSNKNGIGVRIQSSNLIDGELIVNGSIFTNALSTNLINSTHIVTAGLDAAVVKFGVMAGDRIAVNTLTGDRIVANTLSASKLVVTDMSSLDQLDNVNANGPQPYYDGTITERTAEGWFRRQTTASNYFMFRNNVGPVPLVPGDVVRFSIEAYADANVTASPYFFIYGPGISHFPSGANFAITTVPTTFVSKITMPAGIGSDSFMVGLLGVVGANIRVRNVRIQKMGAGELIVDGSITSTHVVTAGLDAAVVKFGTMSGNRILANTLNADRIIANTLNTALINAGTINGLSITGSTITGGVLQTGLAGTTHIETKQTTNPRMFDASSGMMEFFTSQAGWSPGSIWGGYLGALGTVEMHSPYFGVRNQANALKAARLRLQTDSAGTTSAELAADTFLLTSQQSSVDFNLAGTNIWVVKQAGTAGAGLGVRCNDSSYPGYVCVEARTTTGNVPVMRLRGRDIILDPMEIVGGTQVRVIGKFVVDDRADFYNGSGGLVAFVDTALRSPNAANTTSTVAANACINAVASNFFRSTSMRAAKVAIEAMPYEQAEALLDVEVSTWFDRAASESYAEAMDTDDVAVRDELLHNMNADLRRIPGVIAEDVEAASSVFTTRDSEGNLIGVAYDRIGVAWIPLVKSMMERIETLEGKIA